MTSRIVADGEARLHSSPEFQARLRALRESIRSRHATEYETASFLGRLALRWRMTIEYRRERRRIVPSPQSLYSARISERIRGRD
jgi:hypothetical protein